MRKSFGLSLLIARLCRDERGSIIIQATLTIVVIMGMIGLALDGGRLFMVNNDCRTWPTLMPGACGKAGCSGVAHGTPC